MEISNFLPICQNASGQLIISARDLHSFLESRQDFSNWLKNRVQQYSFLEGEDFSINLSRTSTGGRPSIEYAITLDMAKELAMVENNDKGKQARKYFIEKEKETRGITSFRLPQNFSEALRQLANRIDENEKLKELNSQQIQLIEQQNEKLEKAKPAIEFCQAVAATEDLIDMNEAAKILNFENVGRNKLFEILQSEGVLMKGKNKNLPFQRYISEGFFQIKESVYHDPYNGKIRINLKTMVTQRGLSCLSKKLKKLGYIQR